jgi:hypothetical protein
MSVNDLNSYFVFTCQVAYIPSFYSNTYLLLLSTVMIVVQRKAKLSSSVADPGCLSRIPEPDFLPIPDPGSRIPDPKTATKERGEKKLLSYLFI